MKIAFFAGSFDPPTLGHLDIIKRAHALCDRLIVGIATHPQKKPLFTPQERIRMLQKITANLPHVEVISFNTLVVEEAARVKASCLLRALRSGDEFTYEQEMATANRKMGRLETCFLFARPELSEISTSLVKELASHGKRLHGFVPDELEEAIFSRLESSSEASS